LDGVGTKPEAKGSDPPSSFSHEDPGFFLFGDNHEGCRPCFEKLSSRWISRQVVIVVAFGLGHYVSGNKRYPLSRFLPSFCRVELAELLSFLNSVTIKSFPFLVPPPRPLGVSPSTSDNMRDAVQTSPFHFSPRFAPSLKLHLAYPPFLPTTLFPLSSADPECFAVMACQGLPDVFPHVSIRVVCPQGLSWNSSLLSCCVLCFKSMCLERVAEVDCSRLILCLLGPQNSG